MATKLYLRSATAASVLTGTLPTGEQSSATPDVSLVSAYLQTLSVTKSSLAHGSSVSLKSKASAAPQKLLFNAWASLPLKGAQSVGAANIELSLCATEQNVNANFSLNSFNLYVWRPSTGAKISTIVDMPGAGTKTTAAEATTTPGFGTVMESVLSSGLSAVSAHDGDIIVAELWGLTTQDSATGYNIVMFYDAAAENTTNGAAVTAHASFVQFSETLVFYDIRTAAGAAAGAATVAGAGAAVAAGTGAAAGSSTVSGSSINYQSGVGAAAGVATASAQGRGVSAAVATSAGIAVVAGVGDFNPKFAFGEGSAAGVATVAGVGAQYFPHRFAPEISIATMWEMQLSMTDIWTQEVPL